MIHKVVFLSALVISATCMVLHQAPLPLLLLPQQDDPNYNFAYQVNDAHTGDIKSQHESRRGDTVLGQYSLLQPDGVRRTVDYRADDHSGFRATVNNEGRPINQQQLNRQNENRNEEASRRPNGDVQSVHQLPQSIPNFTPSPLAYSRTSVVHSISNGHNPWL